MMLLRALYWAFRIPCVEQRHAPGCVRGYSPTACAACDCVRRLRRIRLREVVVGMPAHKFGGVPQ